jgi:hypothetical protein
MKVYVDLIIRRQNGPHLAKEDHIKHLSPEEAAIYLEDKYCGSLTWARIQREDERLTKEFKKEVLGK